MRPLGLRRFWQIFYAYVFALISDLDILSRRMCLPSSPLTEGQDYLPLPKSS